MTKSLKRALSLKCSREIRAELAGPPADTPARREMFALVREMAELRRCRELRAGKTVNE
jgi:hypothetical protein